MYQTLISNLYSIINNDGQSTLERRSINASAYYNWIYMQYIYKNTKKISSEHRKRTAFSIHVHGLYMNWYFFQVEKVHTLNIQLLLLLLVLLALTILVLALEIHLSMWEEISCRTVLLTTPFFVFTLIVSDGRNLRTTAAKTK